MPNNPAPKLDPVRRNARVGPVVLPAKGREGDPPVWPLPIGASGEQWDAWCELWATPQAAVWERLSWTRTVARYCTLLVVAEEPGASIALLAEVRQLEDRLGLNPRAMRNLLWSVAPDEVAEKRDERSDGVRQRLRAVEG